MQSVAGTVVIAVFVVTFLAQAFTIPSESMEQTLLIGDYLLVDKFCYGGSTGWNRLMPYRNVRRGDVIARSGASGRVTSPHLHYEVRMGGTPVNPYPYMAKSAAIGAAHEQKDLPFD